MRTEVKLSKRLERIASFVQPGSRVADIGTDHGYVPIWLVQKGVCPSALAMDVRKGPLERAEEHVEEVGLSGKIELRLSDGLAKLKAGEADTVVIAGMGGKLTCRILEQGRHVWENWSEGKERLILSPQSEQDEVRHFLEEQGFSKEEIDIKTSRGYDIYKIMPNGMTTNQIAAFDASQRISVKSKDVQKIKKVATDITNLTSKGIDINVDEPSYFYSKLSDVKVKMLEEATKDAKQRASAMLKATHNKVGKIQSVRMGVFLSLIHI